MKYLTTIICFLILQFSVKANHEYGGEITWKCLNNGQFVFSMEVYADGPGFNFTNKNLVVHGSPLPTDNLGAIINNIIMKPKFQKTHSLYTSFYFESDSINLNGTPPPNGWSFNLTLSCCRGTLPNFSSSNGFLLKATMYSDGNNSLVNTCYDNSPRFAELPKVSFNNGEFYTSQNTAIDIDGDSLVHRLAQPFNGPVGSNSVVPFSAGYSFANYTGNANLGGTNVPYSVEPNSGNVIYNYSSSNGGVLHRVVSIDSYKEGVKVATVNREMRIITQNSTNSSNVPELNSSVGFDNYGVYRDSVQVGNSMRLTLILNDTASSGNNMTLAFFGSSFSSDFTSSRICNDVNDTSCATLFPQPTLNSNVYPSRFELTGTNNFGVFLNWTADCYHLSYDGTAKTHYFVVGYEADAGNDLINYRTFAITVLPNPSVCNILTDVESNSTWSDNLQVYPNPTNGKLKLTGLSEVSDISMNVRNSSGQLVRTHSFKNVRLIDTRIDGPSGLYFVELQDANGDKVSLKVIKQ